MKQNKKAAEKSLKKRINKYAFFDVDGTVYDGFSINDFIIFLSKKRKETWALKKEKEIINLYRSGKINYKEGTDMIFEVLPRLVKGLGVNDVQHYADVMIKSNDKKIFSWVFPLIKYLKSENYKIILLSASIEPIISSFTKKLGADNFFSSRLTRYKNRYTGKVEEILQDSKKSHVLTEYLSNEEFSTKTVGFGDSTGDIDMLSKMDISFVINIHQEEMIGECSKRGWHLIDGQNILEEVRERLNKPQNVV